MAYRIPRRLGELIPDGASILPVTSFAFADAANDYRHQCLKHRPVNISQRGYRPDRLMRDWEFLRIQEAWLVKMHCIRAALQALGK